MQSLATLLFTAYFFISSGFLVILAAIIMVVTAPFDPNRRILHTYACAWGHHYIYWNPFWRCRFEGKENIDPKKTYVLVANHQSYTDIIVLYGLFRPYKWVSKEEIFKVPFVGWNMMLNQYVSIARGNLASIKEMMQVCRNWLNRQASILMFPEGTRSEDGEIHGFRDGAFRLAIDCNVPVVPVVVNGTHNVMAKGSKVICFNTPITVKILPPIEPSSFKNSAAFRDHVHALMKQTLAEMRGVSKAASVSAHDEPRPDARRDKVVSG